ncbi:ubiquinone biosynthesis regulatory protein kinase UbiB [Methylophilaceae bacterium]|nr:ubiquinone biosynthesis regulatory protein kinase UbiB [Methylophilaceae bacterium]
MSIFRFLYVIYIVLKFGLDQFLNTKTTAFIHIALLPIRFNQSEENRAARLRIALEDLGPIFVKFGQMLSTRRDLLPDDIANELAKLQDQVPPFSFSIAKNILEKAYRKPLKQQFIDFQETPVASASVAQVHFAKLYTGQEVAVKILRPNIKKQIERDIKLLAWLAYILESLWNDGRRLKPRDVVSEFARHTKAELNLLLEAGHCSHLGENFKDKKLLIVPEVYWDHCYDNVMVMERMNGIPISNIKELNKRNIDIPTLARNGVEIFFTQVFRDGFFHADMHPGNIQVRTDGKYIALDFGIMGTLSEEDKKYLARNFLCFFKRDYRGVAEAHVESGWVPSGTSVDEFENAIRSVCEPIFNKPLKEISFGKLLIRLFQTSRQFNMEIQPQLTMLQKTLLNIEGLGRDLDPNLDLWQTASPFLETWLKKEMGPKKIIGDIKKELPHFLSLAPRVPTLIKSYLHNNELNIKLTTELSDAIKQLRRLKILYYALLFGIILLSILEIYRYIK